MSLFRGTRRPATGATVRERALLAELSAVRAELERRQRFTDVLLETIQVGIVFCDADGGGFVRNRAERTMLGFDVSAAHGVDPYALAEESDVLDANARPIPVHDYPLLRALRGEDVGTLDLLLGPAGGPHREVVSRNAQIAGADGVVLGAVSVLTDVSAERASLRLQAEEHQRLVEAQQNLVGVNTFLDAVLKVTPDDIYVVDLASGDLVYASTGREVVVADEDRARLVAATESVADLPDGEEVELRYRASVGGGPHRWLSHRLTPFRRDEQGVVVEALTVVRDITALVEAEERLSEADRVRRDAESRFRTVFDQAGIGALILGLDGIPTQVNAAACALLGRPPELLTGTRWADYNHPDDVPPEELVRAEMALGHDSFGDERRYVRPDGSVVWASTHVTVVRDEQGVPDYLLAQLADITERKRMEIELEHLALHDSLTGLPNRSLFLERVRHAVLDAPDETEAVAVIVLAVDDLHLVIERDGYAVGDLVLTELARRLVGALGHDVTIGQLQPGQFAVLVTGGTHDAASAAEIALAAMKSPVDLPEGTVTLRASAGIGAATAEARAGLSDVGRLIQDAASAAGRASMDGANAISFASPEMREELEKQHHMEALIRGALDHDDIRVAYQPVLDLSTGLVVGAEALLRVSDDRGRPVAPVDLIPVAENSGLIVEIGLRVLQLAAEQAARWHAEHGVWIPVAVNVSAVQLERADFLDNVFRAVARAGVPPEALSIELTESVLLKAGSRGIEKLRKLRDAGINLAIDDFGTGYASLSYLQDLPASTLKVDRSFVAGIPHDRGAVAIVAAVIGLARNFGMTCIAEGIETEAQLQYLAERNVLGQGYLLGRPGQGAAIDRMLAGPSDDDRSAAGARDAAAAARRDEIALQRDQVADLRDEISDNRDRVGDERDDVGLRRDEASDDRDHKADLRDRAAGRRDVLAANRDRAAGRRDQKAAERDEAESVPLSSGAEDVVQDVDEHPGDAATDRRHSLHDRQAGASERTEAGSDRAAALLDRGAGASERVHAELDRNIALADRGSGADERRRAEDDRATAQADRVASAKERDSAQQLPE